MAKGKVSAYYIAKSLGRMAGSVKLKARSLGLILYKSEGEGEMIVRGPILCLRRNNYFIPLTEQHF